MSLTGLPCFKAIIFNSVFKSSSMSNVILAVMMFVSLFL